jgi:hypothetical protein
VSAVAVRRLAAGIYPAVLTEAGLRSGLAALAEESRYPVRVLAVPVRRFLQQWKLLPTS